MMSGFYGLHLGRVNINRIPKDKSLMKIISCKGDNFKIWDYGMWLEE